jgi:predicted esterase
MKVGNTDGKAWVWLMVSVLATSIGLGGCSGGTASADATPTADAVQKIRPELQDRFIKELFADLDVTQDIQYGTATNVNGEPEKLMLDLYQPKGDKLDSRPAVIFVHGGGFSGGDKAGGIECALAKILAHKGYVTLSINYRLRQTPSANWVGTFADAANDAYTALEWLVNHQDEYRIDVNHIAFGGHSAGSNIVTDLCYSDWTGRSLPKNGIFAVIAMSGPEMIAGRPVKDDPFCIIIHGCKDELVPFNLSATLDQTFTGIGTPHVLYPMPLLYHDLTPAINEINDVVTKYLYQEMTGTEPEVHIRKYEDELK